MKQIGYVHVEVEKNISVQDQPDAVHTFTFSMPMGVPLADASDASFKIFKTIDKMYRDALDLEIKKAEEASLEEDKIKKE